MQRTYLTTWGLVMSVVMVSGLAHAGPDALDKCVYNARTELKGEPVGLRAELEDGEAQYQIDARAADGLRHEVECDPKTGKIRQTERNVRPGDPAFADKAEVRLDAALKTALDAHPGHVLSIEYEVEGDGGVAYEFDIRNDDGDIHEVEVDAVKGKLSGVEQVLYEIGTR